MDLIIDTSSEDLLVLLKTKDNLYKNDKTNAKHLEHLLPQIDNVLNLAQTELNQIKNFCVVVGPGSFTGVRIGVCTVKAFMQNSKAKIVAINMLEFLSFVAKTKKLIKKDYCIVIKSTSTKYYALFANKDGQITKQQMITKDDLLNIKNTQIFTFKNCLKNCEEILNFENIEVDPQDYISFVDNLKSENNFVTEANLKPIYMALSQAEEELAKKERENSAKDN